MAVEINDATFSSDAWTNISIFPPNVPAIDGLREVVSTGRPLLEAAAGIAAAQAFVAPLLLKIDPVAGAIGAVLLAVENLVKDLLAADVYTLIVRPQTKQELLAGFDINSAIRQINEAMFDEQDPSRPAFSSQAACVGFVTFAGAETVVNLAQAIAYLKRLFEGGYKGEWQAILARLNAFTDFSIPPAATRVAQGGVPPDWTRLDGLGRLFPEYRKALDLALLHIKSYAGYGKSTAFIAEFVQFVELWVSRVSAVLDTVEQLLITIDEIAQGARAMVGVKWNFLPLGPEDITGGEMYGYGGPGRFLSRLQQAEPKPEEEYLAGVVVLLGAPTTGAVTATFNALMRLLGAA